MLHIQASRVGLEDPLLQNANSIKTAFTTLEEIGMLESKDAFGDLVIAQKKPLLAIAVYTVGLPASVLRLK